MDHRSTLRVILSGHRWVVGRFPPFPYEIETDLSRSGRLRLLFQLKNGPFRPPLTQARELGVTSLTVSPFVIAACLIGSTITLVPDHRGLPDGPACIWTNDLIKKPMYSQGLTSSLPLGTISLPAWSPTKGDAFRHKVRQSIYNFVLAISIAICLGERGI